MVSVRRRTSGSAFYVTGGAGVAGPGYWPTPSRRQAMTTRESKMGRAAQGGSRNMASRPVTTWSRRRGRPIQALPAVSRPGSVRRSSGRSMVPGLLSWAAMKRVLPPEAAGDAAGGWWPWPGGRRFHAGWRRLRQHRWFGCTPVRHLVDARLGGRCGGCGGVARAGFRRAAAEWWRRTGRLP